MNDKEFDVVLQDLKEAVKNEMPGIYIQNKDRMADVNNALIVAKAVVDCKSIVEKVDDPFIGSADILMSGDKIHITNPTAMFDVLKKADVIEIVNSANNTVSLNATFYDTSGKVVGS